MKLDVIYNEDCLEGMKRLPNESIDLVCTDPPYGVLGERQKWDNVDIWEFTNEWWSLVKKKLKENSAVYCFWSQKYLLEGLQIFKPDRVLIWHHPNLAKTTDKTFLWTYDPVFYIKFGRPVFHANFAKKQNVDVFKYPKPQSNWKEVKFWFHPTCKPLELVKRFIAISSDVGDIVLDPFIGSGTTAVACKQLRRHYIGFEINPEYCEIARKRIENIACQRELFQEELFKK